MYGCDTRVSHTEGEHRLRVFGNRVLRKFLGFMRDIVAEELHSEFFLSLLHTQYYLGDQIKKLRWPGRVVLWERGEVYTGFWWWNLGERDHLEDLGVDGAIIQKWLFKKWDGGKDWIDVAQDREWWRVPLNAGNFFTSWGPVSFSTRTLLLLVRLTGHGRNHFSYVILSTIRLLRSDINGIAQTTHVLSAAMHVSSLGTAFKLWK